MQARCTRRLAVEQTSSDSTRGWYESTSAAYGVFASFSRKWKWPPMAAPEPSETEPDEPELDAPELKVSKPLTPAVPALAVWIVMAPLDVAAPSPESGRHRRRRDTCAGRHLREGYSGDAGDGMPGAVLTGSREALHDLLALALRGRPVAIRDRAARSIVILDQTKRKSSAVSASAVIPSR